MSQRQLTVQVSYGLPQGNARLTQPWQDVPALKLALRGEAASKLQPRCLKDPLRPTNPLSCFSASSVLEHPTSLFAPQHLGQVPFLYHSSSWRPSQTARSPTSRTSSTSLKPEYTNLRKDSEKAEKGQKASRSPCE